MPNKCAAVNCKSGYSSDESKSADVSFHSFPLKNPDLLAKWTRRISREGFTPTKYSRLCSLHFVESDFITETSDKTTWRKRETSSLQKRYLKPDAVPSVFTNLPTYFSSKSSAPRSEAASSSHRHETELAKATQLEKDFFDRDKVSTYDELLRKFHAEPTKPEGFLFFTTQESFNVIHMFSGTPPRVLSSIIIKNTLEFMIYHNDKVVSASQYKNIASGSISCVSQITNLMAFVKALVSETIVIDHKQAALDSLKEYLSNCEDDEESTKLAFLIEQLKLTGISKYGRRYSPELIVMAYVLHSTSAAGYRQLLEQNTLSLPSVSTVKKITKRLDMKTGLDNREYLKMRISKLNEFDRYVVMMIDEIYLGKRVELSGGEIFGITEDGDVAQTALCFMIKFLINKYRDVVGIFPMKSLKAETQFKCYKKVMPMIHEIGFKVISISVDNATANRKFYQQFLCSGQWTTYIRNPHTGQNMYLLFDPTHNLKNVYNNFQKRRIFECPSMPPTVNAPAKANFDDIEFIYNFEIDKPLKMAYKLSRPVIKPKSIEKTNVQLAVSVFHESTIAALKHHNFLDTAAVVGLIAKLWNVMNVRTTSIGKHKRDHTRDPVRSSDDWKLQFLEQSFDFFKEWEDSKLPGLTKETFLAMKQTCKTMAELARYLIDVCGFHYVLLGKIQSDNIEGRFGWIRQLSGSNYFISMRQLVESDKKIRAISLLKFSKFTVKDIEHHLLKRSGSSTISQDAADLHGELLFTYIPDVSDNAIVYYVTGACARSLVRTKKCEACKEHLVSDEKVPNFTFEPEVAEEAAKFMEEIDRGGLWAPREHLFQLGMLCWRVFYEIKNTPELRKKLLDASNQRELFCSVMSITVDEHFDIFIDKSHCGRGHDTVSEISGRFFNCMAKSFVKAVSDVA